MPEYQFTKDILRPYLRDSRAWMKMSTIRNNSHMAARLEQIFKGYYVTAAPEDMRQHRHVITGKVVAAARERMKAEGMCPNSVQRYLSIASAACKYAISELNLDIPNPFQGRAVSRMDARTIRPRTRLLQEHEQSTLLIACQQPLRDMILLWLEVGMRVNEVILLRRSQIDREQRVVRFTPEQHKSGTYDASALTDEAMEIIERQPVAEGCDYVFQRDGLPWKYSAVRYLWLRATKVAGCPDLELRDLRRTGLQRWRNAFGIEATQAQARHKSRQTTERVYARPSVEIAVEALRQGQLTRR